VGTIFKSVTWADVVAAIIAVILTVILGVLAIENRAIPNEIVAFLTLVVGYLFRAAQPIASASVTAATGNGVKP
jgi:Flp pilus assembly protein protease CpaA